MDESAINYDPIATVDDGSCVYACGDPCGEGGVTLAPIPILGNGVSQIVAWVGPAGPVSQVNDIYYQDILGDTPQDFLEGTAVAQVSGEDVNISVYMPSFGGWTEAIEQINYGEGLFIFNTQEGEITGYWIF